VLKLKATIFLLLLATFSLTAQTSSEGRDFWFSFMEPRANPYESSEDDYVNANHLEFFITSKHETKIIFTYLETGEELTTTVGPDRKIRYAVYQGDKGTAFPFQRGSREIKLKSLHVTSDADIQIVAFANFGTSSDATLIYPTSSLKGKYVVNSYFENRNVGIRKPNASQFLIVAVEDSTLIDISPSNRYSKQEPYEIFLNQGETFQIQSDSEDLSGTIIQTRDKCKKIAVFSGAKRTQVANGQDCAAMVFGREYNRAYNGSILFQQMAPVQALGKEFVSLPIQGRDNYLLRVTSIESDTRISSNDVHLGSLNFPGDYLTIELSEANYLKSNKPIQVTQISKSMSCDSKLFDMYNLGAPSMLSLVPNEQMIKSATFNVLGSRQILEYYLNVVVRYEQRKSLKLEGFNVKPFVFQRIKGDDDFAYASVPLLKGQDYTLLSDDGFIGYVYGAGPSTAISYKVGTGLENIEIDILAKNEFLGVLDTEACTNILIEFEAFTYGSDEDKGDFIEFEWDFGDGTLGSGRLIDHVFEQPGLYTISLTAIRKEADCFNDEIFTRQLEIVGIEHNDIVGPSAVCPNTEDVKYSIKGDEGNSYEWYIEGGQMTTANNESSILVDWGDWNKDAWLKLLVKNRLGCSKDTIQFDVVIDNNQPRALPTGPREVCFIDHESVTYSLGPAQGSEYEWFVSNGVILTKTSGYNIDVKWFGIGKGQIWYREYNPDLPNCEGFSEVLEVTIYSDMEVDGVITDARCFNEASGSIALSATGGKPNYTAIWSNGAEGLSISDLVAGVYTVNVIDDMGCLKEKTFVVGEPNILLIESFGVKDASCYQDENGEVSVVVSGGILPYEYFISGTGLDMKSNSSTIAGLKMGEYKLTIQDANNCSVSEKFVVSEPTQLAIDFERLINQPICPQASNGEVSIDALGGTPGYQFFWNTNPPQEGTIATGLSQGKYIVTIIDANGCQTEQEVEVSERFPRIHIPNAFSPNGDGENDEFKAVTDCTLSFGMKVFNKWGLIVFSTSDINEGWDGTYKGQSVLSGNYSYSIFYTGNVNNIPFEESIRGTVRIFR